MNRRYVSLCGGRSFENASLLLAHERCCEICKSKMRQMVNPQPKGGEE